ncbi:MAG: LuxR C-terminal-related transcriptional regulator, partial [Lactobacillales bacterium]|nr:LuxR C-terminal-related transcriptional regulator [Lactobacillales bacterium]
MIPFNETQSISGIVFTNRELEIISCISNGLSVKDTGILLNISHNTVSTHIRNIMQKTGSSSQREILKFLELSDQYMMIHNRYIDLIVINEFEQRLAEIAKSQCNNKKMCIMYATDHGAYEDIYHHLELAGIIVSLKYENFNSGFQENYFHIVCTSTDASIFNNPTKNVVLLSKINQRTVLYGMANPVDDYYLAILSCVGLIYDSDQVKNISNSFQKYYANKQRFSTVSLPNKVSKMKNNRYRYILSSILFSLGIILAYVVVNHVTFSNPKVAVSNIQNINEEFLLSRKNVIKQIDKALKKQSGIKFAVLIGPGGIGKTTVARNYLYVHDFNLKWEINAETEMSISDSFYNLAFALANTKELRETLSYIQAGSDYKNKNKQIISFVFSQLKGVENWCLLFDNVDNFNIIQSVVPFDSKIYGSGSVLITTRNDNFKNVNFLSRSALINIETLNSKESMQLFCDILGTDHKIFEKSKEIEKLLQNIPAMPLDISSAAYFIKNTGTTPDEYLKTLYETIYTEKMETNLLEESSNYKKSRYRIITSIFDTLLKINPNFKELLLLLCLLDSQNIRQKYFEKCKDRIIVQEFIHHLRRFSLVFENHNMISIHRSTQKIGLRYLIKLFSTAEIDEVFNKTISNMNLYNKMMFNFFERNQQDDLNNAKNITASHLQSILNKVIFLPIDKKTQSRYEIKLLFALLYYYQYSKSRKFIQEFAEQIIKLNDTENVLDDVSLAILLEICGNKCTFLNEYIKAKNYLSRCISICKKNKEAAQVYVICLADFAKLFALTGDFDKAKLYLEEASKLVLNSKKMWKLQLREAVFARYFRCYNSYFVCSQELQTVIDVAIDILKSLNANELFYIKGIYNGNYDIPIFFIRKALAGLYNRIGEYDKAYGCEKESLFFLKRIQSNEASLISYEADLNICEGVTLLRKNKLSEAYNKFVEYISAKEKMQENSFMHNVFIFISEVLIRQNKLEKAYEYAKNAFTRLQNSYTNDDKFYKAICCYYLALIELKKNNLQQV